MREQGNADRSKFDYTLEVRIGLEQIVVKFDRVNMAPDLVGYAFKSQSGYEALFWLVLWSIAGL